MKKMLILAMMAVGVVCSASAADAKAKDKKDKKEGYVFTDIKTVETTPVKDQSRSGTCWSFTGNGFLENELLNMSKGEYDLSEMWVARWTYFDKAVKYVRMHGKITFSEGALVPDVLSVIRKHGIVPEEAYKGLNYGMDKHNHKELAAVLEGYVKAVVASGEAKSGASQVPLTTAWQAGINGILDAYFGPIPAKFTYNGVEYTPESFTKSLGLDMDNYVNLTSFTHHPFYTQFVLEIPDNWAWGTSYNVPLDEFMAIFDNAIDNGYSIAWSSDVSEKGFAYKEGLAIIPDADVDGMDGTEQARWVALSDKDKEAALYTFDKPGKEKTITQENRQQAFDNYETTDDHGMIIVGKAKDQAGNEYYKVKNSWGSAGHVYDGFFYASKPFVAYKTMNIIVHKDAIPANVKAKLGL